MLFFLLGVWLARNGAKASEIKGTKPVSGMLARRAPPEVLEKYNQALPGLAERIITMAEKQATHRQQIEKTVIESNAFTQKVAPFLGFIITMTAVGGGTELILKGKDVYGLAAIVTALASLVGVFIYGKKKQRKELDEKANDFAQPKQLAKT